MSLTKLKTTPRPDAQPAAEKTPEVHARPMDPNAMTYERRTQLRRAFLANGTLTAEDGSSQPVSTLVLQGVRFRSTVALKPGDIRQLHSADSSEATLKSAIRIVSCRLRLDGEFDIGAEFF